MFVKTLAVLFANLSAALVVLKQTRQIKLWNTHIFS